MIVENELTPDPALAGLVKSSEKPPPPQDAPAVTPCPYAKPAPVTPVQKKEKPPIRLLMWNIFELGGGFYRAHKRADYAIEAYAALIAQLDIDICVILGITSTVGKLPKPKGEKEQACLIMDTGPLDTGPAEVNRLLDKLKSKDAAGAWASQFLKAKDKYVYDFGATTCFLHRTSKGISFSKLDVIDSKSDPKIGLTGKFLCATFQVPQHKDGPLSVVAPLGVVPADRPLEMQPQAAKAEDVKQTRTLPESCLMALSAPGDLIQEKAKFSDFKADLDAVYLQPGKEGTMLKDEFWKSTVDDVEDLLDNFISVDLGDVRKQDEEMHWEALDQPKHAENMEQVLGYLADTFLICHASDAATAPAVDEMRVVDLVAAALPAEDLAKLKPKKPDDPSAAKFPKEDSALAAQLASYREEDLGGHASKKEAANQLGDCCYFSLALSKHWPVVAQLRLEP